MFMVSGALKKPKLKENSSERGLAIRNLRLMEKILALNRPPEPSPVKRRTDTSDPPPQFQAQEFDPLNEISSPRTPPIFGGLPSPKPHSTNTKPKDDEVPR